MRPFTIDSMTALPKYQSWKKNEALQMNRLFLEFRMGSWEEEKRKEKIN